jgi:membrane fusion protein
VQADAYTSQGGAREIAIDSISRKRQIDSQGLQDSLRWSNQKLAQLEAGEKLVGTQIAQAQAFARAKQAVLDNRRGDLRRQEALLNGGYISRSAYETHAREVVEAQADVNAADQDAADQAVSALQREILILRESRLSGLAARGSAETSVRRLLAESAQDEQRAYLENERIMVAPEDGQVAGIVVRAGDRVIENHTAMRLLAPDGKLALSAYALARDVGLLRSDDPVAIRYDPYPYQKFGVHRGTMLSIAKIPLKASEIDMPLPQPGAYYYRIDIAPAAQCVRVRAECEPLKVGMSSRVRIRTERRSILEWILNPLYGTANAAP